MVPEASKIIGLPHSKFTNQDSSLHVYVPDLSKDQFGIPKRQTIIKEKVTVVATLQFLHVDDLHIARCEKNLACDGLTPDQIITNPITCFQFLTLIYYLANPLLTHNLPAYYTYTSFLCFTKI